MSAIHAAGNPAWVRATTVVYVGGATGVDSATLPTHAVGDLIVAFAFRDGGGTFPTLAAGFTSLGTAQDATAQCTNRIAYRVATVTNTATGTWTDATSVAFVIYRNAAIGNLSAKTDHTTGVFTYPTFAPSNPDGSSLVLGLAGTVSINTNIESPPTGMAMRQNVVDATDEIVIHESTEGRFLWSAVDVTRTGSSGVGMTNMLEIKSA